MRAPIIGISMKTLAGIDGAVASEPSSSVLGTRYIQAVADAGGLPWPIPVLPEGVHHLRRVLAEVDGLLLPGGSDIAPTLYGGAPHPSMGGHDPARDASEAALVRWATDAHLPVLGICRGMQFLNVARGGTLLPDISVAVPAALKHDYFPSQGYDRGLLVHSARALPASKARWILGQAPVEVNSLHHQAVETIGEGLAVTALSPDGVVEAMEDPHHPFFMGVQWHPEEIQDRPDMRALLCAFVEAAARFRATGGPSPGAREGLGLAPASEALRESVAG